MNVDHVVAKKQAYIPLLAPFPEFVETVRQSAVDYLVAACD